MATPFSPITLLGKELPNRVVLAPMTRGRAVLDRKDTFLPGPQQAKYYSQRAAANGGAGLLITEAIPISHKSQGWINVPGLWTEAQAEAWKATTEAVHAADSLIVAQLWHMGRVSHSGFGNGQPWGPSAIRAEGQSHTPDGSKPYETPHEMTKEEIQITIKEYVNATRNAFKAGFDAVEIHAANGYLVHQFLSPKSNQRTDEYGKDRALFLTQILDALQAELGGLSKVSVRLSPTTVYNDCLSPTPLQDYVEIVKKLKGRGLAFLEVVEDRSNLPQDQWVLPELRKLWGSVLIRNSGVSKDEAIKSISSGEADLVSVGQAFIANPGLVRLWKAGDKPRQPDWSRLFYVDSDLNKGYTDY